MGTVAAAVGTTCGLPAADNVRPPGDDFLVMRCRTGRTEERGSGVASASNTFTELGQNDSCVWRPLTAINPASMAMMSRGGTSVNYVATRWQLSGSEHYKGQQKAFVL